MGWRKDTLIFEKDGEHKKVYVYVSLPSEVIIRWKTEDEEIRKILSDNLHKRLVMYGGTMIRKRIKILFDGIKEGYYWGEILDIMRKHGYEFIEYKAFNRGR